MDSKLPPGVSGGARSLLVVIAKIYLHGAICVALLYILFTIVRAILPLYDGVESPVGRVLLAVSSIVLLPPLLGALIRFLIYPFMETRANWHRFANWDERLFSEVARAKESAQVVLVNWPNERIRTMGVLTRTFEDQATGEEMAAVFVMSTSRTRHGYVHVCSLGDLGLTNWTIKDWQLFQFTLGSFGPESVQLTQPDNTKPDRA